MPELSWAEVLQRPDLVDADFEIQMLDGWARGPICGVKHISDMIILDLEWVAFRRTATDPWQVSEINVSYAFSGSQWPLTKARDDYIECRPNPQMLAREGEEALFDQLIRRIYIGGGSKLDPAEVEGLVKLLDPSQWDYPRVNLTEKEWVALCGTGSDLDYESDNAFPALPVCCANISEMRSAIKVVRRQDGFVTPHDRQRLLDAFEGVQAAHSLDEWDSSTLCKLMEQVKLGVTAVQ